MVIILIYVISETRNAIHITPRVHL